MTTGPSLYPKLPKTVIGQVLKADGQAPVEEAIVYVQVADCDGNGTPGQSQEWSRLVYAGGYWEVTFGALRTADLQSWFEFDESGGDSVLLTFEGGAQGKASLEALAVIGDSPRLLPAVTLCAG